MEESLEESIASSTCFTGKDHRRFHPAGHVRRSVQPRRRSDLHGFLNFKHLSRMEGPGPEGPNQAHTHQMVSPIPIPTDGPPRVTHPANVDT
jgi:hypothetical protein